MRSDAISIGQNLWETFSKKPTKNWAPRLLKDVDASGDVHKASGAGIAPKPTKMAYKVGPYQLQVKKNITQLANDFRPLIGATNCRLPQGAAHTDLYQTELRILTSPNHLQPFLRIFLEVGTLPVRKKNSRPAGHD